MARDLNCWRISCTSTRRWSSHSSCGLRKRNICMKFLPHSHGWVEEHRTTVCEDSIHTFHTVCTSSAASVLEAGLRVLIWAWNIRARAPGYHQGSGSFVTVEDRINVDHFFLFFFFLSLCLFFNRLWSTRNLWLAEKQWTVYFTGTPKAVDKDFQRRAVCFLCMTVPILILLREWITSDESWCDADQPTTLFTWPHASRHFSPKVKTTPFHNQKGKISGHRRQQE